MLTGDYTHDPITGCNGVFSPTNEGGFWTADNSPSINATLVTTRMDLVLQQVRGPFKI